MTGIPRLSIYLLFYSLLLTTTVLSDLPLPKMHSISKFSLPKKIRIGVLSGVKIIPTPNLHDQVLKRRYTAWTRK